ncbi:MAG: biopolymer transporter ExbD, partial [Zoogloeaceae bacterium]|nr:biopolymer transporter ExbD [Zoogloeaceae bacterium]
LYWNDTPLAAPEKDALATLEARLAAAVATRHDVEVQLRADRDLRYQQVVEIMSVAKRAGVVKLGFVTTPETGD